MIPSHLARAAGLPEEGSPGLQIQFVHHPVKDKVAQRFEVGIFFLRSVSLDQLSQVRSIHVAVAVDVAVRIDDHRQCRSFRCQISIIDFVLSDYNSSYSLASPTLKYPPASRI